MVKCYFYFEGIDNCPGEFTLYFGCRHEEGDYIFREELSGFVKKGIIQHFHTAFSRDSVINFILKIV